MTTFRMFFIPFMLAMLSLSLLGAAGCQHTRIKLSSPAGTFELEASGSSCEALIGGIGLGDYQGRYGGVIYIGQGFDTDGDGNPDVICINGKLWAVRHFDPDGQPRRMSSIVAPDGPDTIMPLDAEFDLERIEQFNDGTMTLRLGSPITLFNVDPAAFQLNVAEEKSNNPEFTQQLAISGQPADIAAWLAESVGTSFPLTADLGALTISVTRETATTHVSINGVEVRRYERHKAGDSRAEFSAE